MTTARRSRRRPTGRRSLLAVVALVVVLAAACDFQGTWSGPTTTPEPAGATATADLRVVACVPSGACVAAGRAAAVRSGGTWTALPTPPAEISSLACAAVDDCLGGRTNGSLPTPTTAIYHFDGSTWSATNWPTTYNPRSISCPSATTCLAVGENETGSVARKWNGSTFVATTLPTATVSATGVSCTSTTFCLAVGADTSFSGPWAAKWTGGTAWTDVPTSNLTAPLDRVSCQSTTSCNASARPSPEHQLATWNGTTMVGGPTDPNAFFNSGWYNFTCGTGTPTRCFGIEVNSESHASSVHGLVTASAGLSVAPPSHLLDLACATATNCVAIGIDDNGARAAWHFDGTSWTAETLDLPFSADAHLDEVSCPTSSFCMAIGTYAHGNRRRPYVVVWNGTTWAPPATPLPIADDDLVAFIDADITCLSARFCAATVQTEDLGPEFPVTSTTMFVWNGSTWAEQPGAAPVHLVCFSTTSCIGLDYGASYSWNGSVVTHTLDSALTVLITGLSCATPTRCVALTGPQSGVLDPNELATWDGTTFARVTPPAPPGQGAVVTDVSCVGTAPTRCVVVGAVGPLNGLIATEGSPYALTGDGTGTWTSAALPASGPGLLRAVSCPDTAECLAVGTGSASGTAHPELLLAMAFTTWKVAPDLPAVPVGSVQYEGISCVPGWCNAIGTQGPVGSRDAVAATYHWTYG